MLELRGRHSQRCLWVSSPVGGAGAQMVCLIVNVSNPRQPLRKSAGGVLFVIASLLYFITDAGYPHSTFLSNSREFSKSGNKHQKHLATILSLVRRGALFLGDCLRCLNRR